VTDNKAYDTHKIFLSKVTFEGKLSYVTELHKFLLAKVKFQK